MKLQLSLILSLSSFLPPSLCPSCDTDGQLQSHCNLGSGGGVGWRGRGREERRGRRMCLKKKGRRTKIVHAAAAHAKLDGGFREISISITDASVSTGLPLTVTLVRVSLWLH